MTLLYTFLLWCERIWYMARFRLSGLTFGLSRFFGMLTVKLCPENATWIEHEETNSPDNTV